MDHWFLDTAPMIECIVNSLHCKIFHGITGCALTTKVCLSHNSIGYIWLHMQNNYVVYFIKFVTNSIGHTIPLNNPTGPLKLHM